MTREELSKNIGDFVLKSFDEFMKDPKGKSLNIPIMLPRLPRLPDENYAIYPRFSNWIMKLEVSAPVLTFKKIDGSHEFLSPSEYFEMLGILGWDKKDA